MSELYPAIKHLHMLLAVISILFFLFKSGLRFAGSPLLNNKPLKIVPHANNGLLILCGILLTVIAGFNPATNLWLLAKLVLLLGYIACGVFVIKWNGGNGLRVLGVLVALVCFAGMGMLAVAKPF
jgi:uncharacterized membrane protein SirB2